MIAKLLISKSLDNLRKEVDQTLRSHTGSGNTDHPDILYFPADSKLGIAEARKIKEHFSLKPYSAKGRAVVLEDASTLTTEAQNSLLKTLEELPKEGIFILGAENESKLLPTILSRCQVEFLSTTYHLPPTTYSDDIERLLRISIEERFEYIEKLKDREEFLHAMTHFFHKKLNTHERPGLTRLNSFLQELLQAEEWAAQNVNIRAILEYLMLMMPKAEE